MTGATGLSIGSYLFLVSCLTLAITLYLLTLLTLSLVRVQTTRFLGRAGKYPSLDSLWKAAPWKVQRRPAQPSASRSSACLVPRRVPRTHQSILLAAQIL